MISFDEMHVNYNISSQLKSHSITTASDFLFCDIQNTKYHRDHDENLGFSPPLWFKNLPSNSTSSSSPTKTMVEGGKEVMEMINDLPESWYELSLKEMVEKDSDDLGFGIEDKVDMKPNKLKGKKKGVKKGAKKGPILRSVSLDTGVFLLKMFVPSSFGSKKHTLSRSTSINGLKKCNIDVKQLKSRFFVENKSNNNIHDNRNRCEEGTLKPGCGSTNQKWCIFF